MGIHCLDVSQIVHVGPPDDVESYIQEVDRASADRDGEESIAVLLLLKGARLFKDLKNSSICRRDALFSSFEGYQHNAQSPCFCCDVCRSKCTNKSCPVCTGKVFSFFGVRNCVKCPSQL